MARRAQDWSPYVAAERPVERFPAHGRWRLGLAYANSYHVAMSSLGFQRVYELVHRRPEWTCERFFAQGPDVGGATGDSGGSCRTANPAGHPPPLLLLRR